MLVLIARSYEDCAPTRDDGYVRPATLRAPTATPPRSTRRVLILGWSHKTPSIVRKVAKSELLDLDLTVVSRIPESERHEQLHQAFGGPSHMRIQHIQADYVASGVLERMELRMRGDATAPGRGAGASGASSSGSTSGGFFSQGKWWKISLIAGAAIAAGIVIADDDDDDEPTASPIVID